MKCIHCNKGVFIDMDRCLAHWDTDLYECDDDGFTTAEVSPLSEAVFDAISELTDALESCAGEHDLARNVSRCMKRLNRLTAESAQQ